MVLVTQGDSRMETNEQIKSVLRKTLEDELEQFLEQMSELAEGDLEKLEEEAAETLCRSVPIGMSGRQALSLMRPVGEALASAEDRQVKTLQAQAKQARSQPQEPQPTKEIERLYIELDGVLARMRRGSVSMEKEELQRKGDVYREIKAGAVFRAERGPKRSELAPGVYVDTPAQDSVRYVARRTANGGFHFLLYHFALPCGLDPP